MSARLVFFSLVLGLSSSCTTPETKPPSGNGSDGSGLTRSEILSVIEANQHQVQSCYEMLLERIPGIGGKLTVTFDIGGTGAVIAASISGGIDDETMRGCVVSAVKSWQFPKPKNAATVNVIYPFVFEP